MQRTKASGLFGEFPSWQLKVVQKEIKRFHAQIIDGTGSLK
jgi:hypothetical protein